MSDDDLFGDHYITQPNELRITIDVPHHIRLDRANIRLEPSRKQNVMRYELVIPTMPDTEYNQEWACRHDTAIVDIRSGVTGTLTKRTKTRQRRAVITNYHITSGRPNFHLDDLSPNYSIPIHDDYQIPAHLRVNNVEPVDSNPSNMNEETKINSEEED